VNTGIPTMAPPPNWAPFLGSNHRALESYLSLSSRKRPMFGARAFRQPSYERSTAHHYAALWTIRLDRDLKWFGNTSRTLLNGRATVRDTRRARGVVYGV
jgi:hypothetical protein